MVSYRIVYLGPYLIDLKITYFLVQQMNYHVIFF